MSSCTWLRRCPESLSSPMIEFSFSINALNPFTISCMALKGVLMLVLRRLVRSASPLAMSCRVERISIIGLKMFRIVKITSRAITRSSITEIGNIAFDIKSLNVKGLYKTMCQRRESTGTIRYSPRAVE